MRRLLIGAAIVSALGWAGAAQAGTFSMSGNDVTYAADPGEANNVFLVFEEEPVRGLRLIDLGATVAPGPGCSSAMENEAFCPTPDFPGQILVTTDDGDDYINTVAATVGEVRLEGGDGDDELYSGQNLGAVLDGGLGADVLSGEFATVDYSSRTNPLTISMGDGGVADDGEAGENDVISNDVSRVLGGSGADTFTLTRSDGSVDAGAGADHLIAIRSDNCGLFGAAGNDEIEVDRGHCSLLGGSGNDTLVAQDGGQFLDGGDGNDELRAGPGRDSIAGEGGADEIIGGKGRDHIRGGSGDDTIRAKDGVEDFIDGNHGTDRGHVDRRLDELHDIEQLF
jgi:Ca2+-binding RTX toxin-like protein